MARLSGIRGSVYLADSVTKLADASKGRVFHLSVGEGKRFQGLQFEPARLSEEVLFWRDGVLPEAIAFPSSYAGLKFESDNCFLALDTKVGKQSPEYGCR